MHFKLFLLPMRGLQHFFMACLKKTTQISFIFLFFSPSIFHLCFHHLLVCLSSKFLLFFIFLSDGLRLVCFLLRSQGLALSLWFIYSWGYFATKLRKFGCKIEILLKQIETVEVENWVFFVYRKVYKLNCVTLY